MKSILPLRAIPAASSPPPFFSILCFPLLSRLKHRSSFGTRLRAHSLPLNTNSYPSQDSQNNQQPRRTLYPGGYKRPEIKVPNLVLQLDVEEVLRGGNVLDLIDKAVAKSVGIVVLNSAQGGSGGKLYEAACLLKSVVKDRAYFLIAERVDIAAAVNASGVVLSDQGLPGIVARNTMLASLSDSVVLPLVARIVQTTDAAVNASISEGADFLIYGSDSGDRVNVAVDSLFKNAKIPVFAMYSSHDEAERVTSASQFLKLGAAGLVVSLEDLRFFSDDVLSQVFDAAYSTLSHKTQDEAERSSEGQTFNLDIDMQLGKRLAGFIKLEDREKQLIEAERLLLLEALDVIKKAAPLMEEISLLTDAISRIDEPFLLVIAGEFNSGKSTVINALLGKRYLKEGVVPTTNEITFLCYSELESGEQQRCERHPDGQYICYIPAPILKDMNIVDTPGTNVILQRQQRLTEEFVPRADLLLFVISADRPLTESEVTFLRYTQQWKKKIVFVLNKSDIYRTAHELEEAISFVKENTRKLLNSEDVILYPVSARSALEAKLLTSSVGKDYEELLDFDYQCRTQRFHELEEFLYSFLDGSTDTGIERIKLKLGTPVAVAERLLAASETLVRQDCEYARQDLALANRIVDSVNEYRMKIENESISWKRQALSMIDSTKSRVVELIESTLQLSNLDLVASHVFRGERSATVPTTSRFQNDILAPALLDAQKLLGEYVRWLQSNNARGGRLYKESFENKWPSLVNSKTQLHMEMYDLLKKVDELSLKVVEDLSASATSKLLEQEIREVFLGTFGGLGAAGFSASLLTSVLPTTLEDLLALGLCSAGGLLAVSNFPARRQAVVDKVNKVADGLARQLEEGMEKDLLESISKLENFVKIIGKPYQEEAQNRLDWLLDIQNELAVVGRKLQNLQVEIQNIHVS